jgi:hypothetical protein
MSTRYVQIIYTSGYIQNITYFICIEHGAQAPWCPGYFTYIYIEWDYSIIDDRILFCTSLPLYTARSGGKQPTLVVYLPFHETYPPRLILPHYRFFSRNGLLIFRRCAPALTPATSAAPWAPANNLRRVPRDPVGNLRRATELLPAPSTVPPGSHQRPPPRLPISLRRPPPRPLGSHRRSPPSKFSCRRRPWCYF